jgi:hypothetical protein
MRAFAVISLLIALAGCMNEAQEPVLSGRCDEGTTHCVDSKTIQFCSGELWQEPQDCPTELSGTPPVQIEIITYCSEGGCRPGG